MTYSRVTLEPLPTAEQIFKDMVQLYLDEKGYGDLFDAYKVLLPMKTEDIGIKLFEQIEDLNRAAMLQEGRCPDCGCELVNRYTPGTRLDPPEHRIECPECMDEFNEAEVANG